jgi:hypothetical protein
MYKGGRTEGTSVHDSNRHYPLPTNAPAKVGFSLINHESPHNFPAFHFCIGSSDRAVARVASWSTLLDHRGRPLPVGTSSTSLGQLALSSSSSSGSVWCTS